jgi:hypothetical protein
VVAIPPAVAERAGVRTVFKVLEALSSVSRLVSSGTTTPGGWREKP